MPLTSTTSSGGRYKRSKNKVGPRYRAVLRRPGYHEYKIITDKAIESKMASSHRRLALCEPWRRCSHQTGSALPAGSRVGCGTLHRRSHRLGIWTFAFGSEKALVSHGEIVRKVWEAVANHERRIGHRTWCWRGWERCVDGGHHGLMLWCERRRGHAHYAKPALLAERPAEVGLTP